MATHATPLTAQTDGLDDQSWSTSSSLDHTTDTATDTVPDTVTDTVIAGGADRPRVRADALSRAIGAVEIDAVRQHHLALAMAVVELAADAGAPLPWSHDDPTVALLRAVAKLSLTAPGATSSAASDLLDRLALDAPTGSTDR